MTDLKSQENKAFTPIPPAIIETTMPEAPAAYDIPDGGYGWIVVCGIFVINAFAWGVGSVKRPIVLLKTESISNSAGTSHLASILNSISTTTTFPEPAH